MDREWARLDVQEGKPEQMMRWEGKENKKAIQINMIHWQGPGIDFNHGRICPKLRGLKSDRLILTFVSIRVILWSFVHEMLYLCWHVWRVQKNFLFKGTSISDNCTSLALSCDYVYVIDFVLCSLFDETQDLDVQAPAHEKTKPIQVGFR